MRIYPTNQTLSSRENKNIYFKQIRPQHLFINIKGFDKDDYWAFNSIKIINKTKENIQIFDDFSDFISHVAKKYHEFYLPKYQKPQNILYQNSDKDFGVLRKRKNETWSTHIKKKGKHEPYREKLIKMIEERGCYKEGSSTSTMAYTYFLNQVGKKEIPLAKIYFKRFDYEPDIDYSIYVQSSPVESIEPTYKFVDKIFKKIMKNKKQLTPQNMEKIIEDVAQIQWFISQLRPYKRGSAGIADIISKVLFEYKGIQVSPYKRDINPNMEAYTLSLEEYKKEYKNFFSSPLIPINQPKNI